MAVDPDSTDNSVRFHVRLAKDGDYPPHDVESLWAWQKHAEYVVDSVPFFCDEIAPGDSVALTSDEHDKLWFQSVVRKGGHSVVRVAAHSNFDELVPVRDWLRAHGCQVESAHQFLALAVDVPPGVDYSMIAEWLDQGEQAGKWEWGEGALHS